MTITRGTRNRWQLGFSFTRHDGNPSLSDPSGSMKGWAVALYLGFINFGFRFRRDSGKWEVWDGTRIRRRNA